MRRLFRDRRILHGTIAVGFLAGAFGINATLNGDPAVSLPDGVVLFGQESVTLDRDVNVLSGDIASNGELEIARDGLILGSIVADEVELEQGVRIAGNVEADEIEQERATIEGEAISPRTTADFALPEIPAFAPGTTDLVVKKSEIATIQPGSYRNFVIGVEAKLTVTGGTYNLRSLKIERDVVLNFSDPVTLNVTQTFTIDRHVIFNLDPDLDINDIRFNYTGTNTAKIERDSFIAGKLLAPNAAVFLGRDSIFRGQVAAKRIGVGRGTMLSREAAFDKPSDPEKIIEAPIEGQPTELFVNEIVLLVKEEATEADVLSIAQIVDGEIIGLIPAPKIYKLEVNTATFTDLDVKIQAIKDEENNLVVDVIPNLISQ